MNSEDREECCEKHSESQASQKDDSCKRAQFLTMADVLERGNMFQALKRVKSNKGSAGIDGMTTDQMDKFLKDRWLDIKKELLNGQYCPSPVKQIYIPKKNGKMRMLGIPTVLDRLIQQALSQKLSAIFDKDFSVYSFGFRPKKSAHQAINLAKYYQTQGHQTTVEIDLEKFFDVVNHDLLMSMIAKKVQDKMILKLIRKYLRTGMMSNGIEKKREIGTPQGSPLSPLLSNILLDELDKELEKRGHKFCRYADDFIIFVKTESSAARVLSSLKNFIEKKLKLKVNDDKSKVGPSYKALFLGYSFLGKLKPKLRCSEATLKSFKEKIREITKGHRREGIEKKIERLNIYLRGWVGYFQLAETFKKLEDLDGWIRSRLRMCLMKQWFFPRTRIRNLINLGMPIEEAKGYGSHRRWWFYAQLHHTRFYLNNKYWAEKGFRGIIDNLVMLGKI